MEGGGAPVGIAVVFAAVVLVDTVVEDVVALVVVIGGDTVVVVVVMLGGVVGTGVVVVVVVLVLAVVGLVGVVVVIVVEFGVDCVVLGSAVVLFCVSSIFAVEFGKGIDLLDACVSFVVCAIPPLANTSESIVMHSNTQIA